MRRILYILLIYLPISLLAQQNSKLEKEGYQSVGGVELYYQSKGEGQPLVVLSGPGMDGSYFRPSMDPLSNTFRLISYDHRGLGKSKGPLDTLKLTMDHFVEDLEGLRQALGIEKMHVMGHSKGGLFAMYYALKYPQHLASLILISSAGADPSYAESQSKTVNQRLTAQEKKAVSELTAPGALDSKAGWVNLFNILWRPYVFDQQKVPLIKDAFGDNTSLILEYTNKSIEGYNLYKQLASLKVPTLLIHGEYDPVPLWASQKIQQAIKGSKLVVLAKCGHFPFIEQPEEFTKTVVEFTQSIHKK